MRRPSHNAVLRDWSFGPGLPGSIARMGIIKPRRSKEPVVELSKITYAITNIEIQSSFWRVKGNKCS
jgi:hypothetical protein